MTGIIFEVQGQSLQSKTGLQSGYLGSSGQRYLNVRTERAFLRVGDPAPSPGTSGSFT
jgi:hypothetical protein